MGSASNRRIKIMVCVVGALVLCGSCGEVLASPSTPDNAALLYYQACLARSGLPLPWGLAGAHDENHLAEETKLLSGNEYRLVIDLTMAGTRIRKCDWGLWVSGRWTPDGALGHGPESLGRVLAAQATILAMNGQYSEAIEIIAALRRLSRHIGDDTYVMWASSFTVDYQTFGVAQYLLCRMPADADRLKSLESELAEDRQWQPSNTLMKWYDMQVASLQASMALHSDWRQALRTELEAYRMREGDNAEKLIESATAPKQVFDHVRQVYKRFVDSVIAVLESDESYHAKHKQIVQLKDELVADMEAGDAIILVAGPIGFVEPCYRLHINELALAHAVQAAIPIYRVKSTTGRLPPTLPAGLPKDPYSSQDFDYHVTDEGFSLTCRAPAIDWGQENNPRRFVFEAAE
ncbi:MAG TPA: hypothetical protein PK316_21880 [Sedimentisphaerales bacterium]|nr:hypothetical protein [Sedimentisphaerales bacterium]